MNFFETLEKQLKNEPNYVTDDGALKKWVVLNKAQNVDAVLIELLLESEELKEKFFIDVKGTLVFKQNVFVQFLEQKNYLNNSYTRYKNKVGLTIDGKYLKQRNDVALVWPFKDCVLEGGQSREEDKREEIFFNETLAQDEITQLRNPKVLTNAKTYDKQGEHDFTGFSRDAALNKQRGLPEDTITDNLILKGNNLLALHSLKKEFAGKVKLIYIDPPYNTGSDSFKYNDSFNHSSWLTFMKNRLKAARELLHPEGIIFIHTGDQELHYLKVLTDEIFGRDKFIATIPRKTRSGKTDVSWKLSQDFDWMLIYTKKAPKTTSLFKRAIERRYYKSDDYPNDEWRLSDLTKQTSTKERPNSDFTLVNPRNGDEYPVNPNRSWAVTVDTVDDYIERGKIVFPGDYDFLNNRTPSMRVFKSEEKERYGEDFDKTYVSSDFLNNAMDDLLGTATYNKKGTDEIVELFGDKKFDYPKNELLLKRIIEYATVEGDIVLDFFAGSGTTSAVAHKMGRKYIITEQMNYVNSVTVKRLQQVIEGEQGGISEEVDWQGGGSSIYLELKKYNQNFIEQIEEAKDSKALLAIWERMKEKSFLNYNVDIKKQDEQMDEFKTLSLSQQKQHLCEILDKNQLYVNLSSLNDNDFACSDKEKKLTRDFYQIKK